MRLPITEYSEMEKLNRGLSLAKRRLKKKPNDYKSAEEVTVFNAAILKHQQS